MPFWQRLGLAIVAIVAASLIAGLIWQRLFSFTLPSYLGSVIGGLAAVPVWELLSGWVRKSNLAKASAARNCMYPFEFL